MNPGQFEQIMVNLAVNARDAMPAGGTFTIATCIVTITETDSNQWLQLPPNIYALIEVSDTGSGMSEEVQKQIFEPFFTTKEMGKGTGLGLAICHGIIRQNGGHIQVHSQLDKGTVFSLYLPITERQPEVPTLFAEQVRTSGTETILLVEDDEPVRAMAAEVLVSHGYKVLACAAGSEALQRARDYAAPISLLMTDMLMPQMSGREVAEQFMHLHPGVPVLLVSGYVGELPESLVNQPNVRFLPKPYSILHLVEAVRTSIDQQPWRVRSLAK
jgi:CheY-like chemotaxis protein